MRDFSRELLWYSFLELVTIVLPSINIHLIKSWIQNKFKTFVSNNNEENTFEVRHGSGERNENVTRASKKMMLHCTICKQSPMILPATGGCGHYFCYYCICGNLEANMGSTFSCPECNAQLTREKLCFPASANLK